MTVDAGAPLQTDSQEERSNKKVSEIISKRNHPLRRIWRFIKATWFWISLILIITGAALDREFLNAVLLILERGLTLLFFVSIVLMQFVAIFWFMGRSKTEVIRPEDPKMLSFDDYKGQPQLLKLVRQWISLLSDRSKFQVMGGQFINGLLLYGPPGTGKTMLAKAMAGEAGVAFISVEGSGFRAMFWGVDVLKMISFIRKARKMAREYGACIAFIDEIDAIGASRGGVMGGQQTGAGMGVGGGVSSGGMGGGTGALTRLLYEMDGVEEKTRFERWQGRIYKLIGKEVPKRDWHVLYMGSTNRPGILDPALTRPGRFDRSVAVERPDRTGRKSIVEYYLGKIKHDDSVDVEAIVGDTPNYTPAQIMAAITKDAVRLAIFDHRDAVCQRDIDLAFQEQAMGLENPIEDMQEDQREQVAYHEAGHAVAVHYLMPDKRIVRTTIIRRSNALGYVLHADNFETYAAPISDWIRRMMVSLAGDVATKIIKGEPWTGTSGDFQTVRSMLWLLATNGYFGPPVADPQTEYKTEMKKFWEMAEERTHALLKVHWDEVEAIAQALLDKGDLSGKEVLELLGKSASPDKGKDAPKDPEPDLPKIEGAVHANGHEAKDEKSDKKERPDEAEEVELEAASSD